MNWNFFPFTRSKKKAPTEGSEGPRRIPVDGEITDEAATQIIAQLLFLNMQSETEPIELLIDSQGGSITATFAILDTIAFCKAPVYTTSHGQTHGCALAIFGSGKKGHRRAGADAILGLNRTALEHPLPSSSEALHHAERINNRMVSLLMAASGRTEAEVRLGMVEERSFSSEGLREFGLIDQIIPQHSVHVG